MKVFISHKKEDEVPALIAYSALIRNGHHAYLDVVDDMITKNGDDLSEYLRYRLTECDSLLAVISRSTTLSWWVPWEIGVATEKNYPLSTYLHDNSEPPEYLRKWPVLRSAADLSIYIHRIGTFETGLRKSLLAHKSHNEALRENVPDFHRNLKRAIGQII